MIAVRWCEALDAFAAGADRLVHPSVRDAQARARQARLIAALLCGIGLFSLSLCIVLPGKPVGALQTGALGAAGAGAVLALLCVAARGPERLANWLALGSGALAAGSTGALGGGLASPLALALVALPVEAWNVRRASPALAAGLFAAALAAGGPVWTQSAGAVAAVHPASWLPVLLWGGTLLLRARQLRIGGERSGAVVAAPLEAGVVVLRLEAGGETTDVSDSAREVLGLAPELLLSNGMFERLHVADRVLFLCALGDLKHGSAERRRLELRLRLPRPQASGRPVFGCFSLELFREGGAAVPFTGLLRDIGEVQELREALQAARESEARAAAEKARLLATLGHELRTPLNAILGFSGLLGSDALGGLRDMRQKEYAELIQNCGEHLLTVLDSMLDVGRLQAGGRTIEPETFRLGDAVEACRAMMSPQAGAKGVSLQVDAARPDAAAVCADRRIVQQILVNLVSNAVKFTPAGGRVSIAAQAASGEIRLCVRDTGIGIAGEDLPRLGTPWTRLDGTGAGKPEGCGLGFSLVRELAELHGGAVSIESARGRGTEVSVFLPDAAGQSARAAEAKLSSIGDRARHGSFRKTA